MQPGIYQGMSIDEYHGHTGSISKSGLDQIARSPAHYFAKYLDVRDKPEGPTAAMKLGSAVHTMVLEPHQFDARYALAPADAPKRPTQAQLNAKNPSADSVRAIAFWQQFDLLTAGKEIISQDYYDTCRCMRDSVMAHSAAAWLLQAGTAETSMFANDPETGAMVRVRPDWITEGGIVADLKTTEDARPSEFGRSCYNFRYHVQDALYQDVPQWLPESVKLDGFVFIAVEKKPPYAVVVYEADDLFIGRGRDAYRRDLDTYAQCLQSGKWPAYPTEVQTLSLPAWAKE